MGARSAGTGALLWCGGTGHIWVFVNAPQPPQKPILFNSSSLVLPLSLSPSPLFCLNVRVNEWSSEKLPSEEGRKE